MTDILYRTNRDSRRSRRRHRLPTGEVIDARGVIASAGALAALTAVAAGGSAVAAGAMSAHAAGKAAKLQTDAANHAADLQDTASQRAEAFQRQQAENDFLNQEAARKANYDQYMGRRNAASALGGSIGFNLPEAQGYVPGIDPHYTTAGSPAPPSANGAPTQPGQPATGQPAAPGNLSDPSAWMGMVANTPQLTSWVQSHLGPNAKPDLVNYYVGKIKGQPGANPTEQAGSANYWAQKIQADPSVTGRSASPLASRSVSSYLQPPSVAAMAAPTADFKLRSINAFTR